MDELLSQSRRSGISLRHSRLSYLSLPEVRKSGDYSRMFDAKEEREYLYGSYVY